MLGFRGLYLIFLICLFACSDKSNKKELSDASVNRKSSEGRQTIVVAIADAMQHPLVFEDGSGISNDIVTELNRIQDKYLFTHKLVPNKRMKELGASGKVSIVSFTNPKWGWDRNKVEKSDALVHDKDVFIALIEEGRDLSYFNNFKSLSIIGVKGFHYNFSDGFKAFIGATSEKAVIDLLLLKRGNAGVISSLNLQYLSISEPEIYSKLLISDKYDSEYSRSFVVMKNAPISVDEVNTLIQKIKADGTLKKIFTKYGLKSYGVTQD